MLLALTYVGQSCQTPSNKSGSCAALQSCPSLYQLQLTSGQNSSTADFLRTSQCGNLTENGMPVVCCTDPIPQTTSIMMSATRKPAIKNATTSVNYGECGKSDKRDSAIVGHKYARLGDWPWVVALGQNNSNSENLDFKCGGTLISSEWVLTAAHCIQNIGNIKLTARLADLDLDPNINDRATPVDAPISEIIPHPEYTTSPFIINDIALLRLKSPVQFNKYIRPACLLSGNDHRSDKYYLRKKPFIVGWGNEWRDATSSELQENTFPIVNQTSCAEKYATEKSAKIDQRVLCAGERGTHSHACKSDSGCTLIFPVSNKTVSGYYHYFGLGGILSFSVQNADLGHPGVYTRVAAFTDWISKTTGLSF